MNHVNAFIDQIALMAPYMMPALLARLIWHHSEVKRGRRRGLAMGALAADVLVAAFSTYIGMGIAEYAELGWRASMALCGACAWIGPTGVQSLLMLWLQKRGILPEQSK